jgi:hypothetical protein
VQGDKWIVTTVGTPRPEAVRQLLKVPGWQLMIIGEKTTPQNWSDQFSSKNLLYLSFEEQMQLDFHLVRYLSHSINSQKNIGYLIAILCGAKIIYELDSDSVIWGSDIQAYSDAQSAAEIPWLAFRPMRSQFVNIYGIFGQPQIWPRGLPISDLQNISEDGWSSLRRNDNETINAYIQQMLFYFDPDVDAVTRLTRPTSIRRTIFDQDRSPIAIEPFTFSPYNSQNTIHYLSAFWGLYLPVTANLQVADIWRSFWVQRLLWDIEGHLLFATSNVKRYKRLKVTVEDVNNEQIIHNNANRFVHFLSSWKPTASTLSERIQELTDALIEVNLLDKLESKVIHAWLRDLSRINYKFPSLKNADESQSSSVRVKRAAVCLTGLAECVQEIWAANEVKLRRRLNNDIDVFLFLSATDETMNNPSPTTLIRSKQARYYNATVNIVHQNILDINPAFPSTCKYWYKFTKRPKIIPIEQERLAQANCYNIVREYEKKRRIRYQLLVRARADSVFTRLPMTFERNGTFNINSTIVVPNEHHHFGVNDRFAIGPIGLMKYYMSRWHQLSLCLTENVHPESFLAFVLQKNGIKVASDIEISLVQVPHGKNQCH